MDERRDLVDREELRRRIAEDPFSASEVWEMHLDAMDAVECPRGWTRDEVLKELDADPDAVCDDDLLYMAWGLIANATGGDWNEADRLSPGWKAAAERWRDAWHRTLPVRVAPEPEWVPLHEVIGRIPEGHNIAVRTVQYRRNPDGWIWDGGGEHVGSHLKVNDDGRVAVRPKAAT